ncbi:MAG TPA: chemotaxis protein CheW [Burkholderiales bacterium]|nr:chemotaxis protein CheW [Burkholderiales bacterium]
MKAGRVDWEAAKRRIKAIDAMLDNDRAPGPMEIARILAKRARRLALEIEHEKDEEKIEVVGFMIGGEHYAVESRHVRGVHLLEQLTGIPCTPDFVTGIVNLRGEILSVVDIRKFFGLPGTGLAEIRMIVLLEKEDMRFCILADAVSGVHAFARKSIKQPPSSLSGADHVQGMAPGNVVLLDAVKLLTDRRLIVEEEA